MRSRIARRIGAIAAGTVVAVTVVGADQAHGPARIRPRSLLVPNTSRPLPPLPAPLRPDTDDRAGLTARLLGPADLPQLVSGTGPWQELTTYLGPGQASDTPCQLRALDRLGAEQEAYRMYRQPVSPGGRFNFYYAAHLVADFPSEGSAAKAASELGSWIGRCATGGYLPEASVSAWAAGRWSVTSTVPGPDPNPRLGAAVRAEGEFAVDLRGRTVSVLYVGTESIGSTPRELFAASAAKAAAALPS